LFIYFLFQLFLATNIISFKLFLNEKTNGSDQIWINIKIHWLKTDNWKLSDQIWINIKVQWFIKKLTQNLFNILYKKLFFWVRRGYCRLILKGKKKLGHRCFHDKQMFNMVSLVLPQLEIIWASDESSWFLITSIN
jgi:hypothetical protein